MQFVRFEDTPLQTRAENHRVGTFRFKDLGQGQPGPDNFYLRWVLSTGDFFSPRHFHNFDQVRLQVRGTFSFADDGRMEPGCIGYFPESTPYGPQTSAEDTVQLVMQIGAPSGAGYVGEEERVAAVAALSKSGRFEGGRYFEAGDTGSTGQDGFEAAWEQASGRRIQYGKRRFEKAMLVHPEAYEWLDLAGTPGVRHKKIWDFGSRAVGCSYFQLSPGSALPMAGPLSCYLLAGRGTAVQGMQRERYAESDALHLKLGETARLQAQQDTTVVVLTHPVFSESQPPAAGAVATSSLEHA